MKIHTIAVSLPQPGYYIHIARLMNPALRVWGRDQLNTFLALRESVANIYMQKDGHPDKIAPLYIEGISADQAVSRMIPVALDVNYSHKKPGTIVNRVDHDLEVIGHIGGKRDKDGIRLTLISKEPGTLEPTPELQELIEPILNGRDFHTLEARSNRDVIAAAATLDHPFRGAFRLVAVPLDRKVRLTRNSQGEYVTEVPEVWA